MMALKTIRNYKNLVALVFALSILAVTACDVFCSIDRSGSMVMKNSSPVSGSMQDSHHHDKSNHHHSSTKNDTGHSHSSSSTEQDDDCCKDVTNQFYKSLFNQSGVTVVKAPIQSFILLVAISNYSLLLSQQQQKPFTVLVKVPPNLTGNHIRILISSFLI